MNHPIQRRSFWMGKMEVFNPQVSRQLYLMLYSIYQTITAHTSRITNHIKQPYIIEILSRMITICIPKCLMEVFTLTLKKPTIYSAILSFPWDVIDKPITSTQIPLIVNTILSLYLPSVHSQFKTLVHCEGYQMNVQLIPSVVNCQLHTSVFLGKVDLATQSS